MKTFKVFGLLCIALLLACSDDENKSAANELLSFSIPELNCNIVIAGNVVSCIVPAGTSLANLTYNFEVSPKAILLVNNVVAESGVSKADFSSPVQLVIRAENGKEKMYTVVIGFAPNQKPVARAGADQIVFFPEGTTGVSVVLDGSLSSDVEGPISEFKWIINNNVIATGSVIQIQLSEGKHTITLEVTDQNGDKSTDEVIIYVYKQINYQPVDNGATTETKNLLNKLGRIGVSHQFIFGQEFPMSFKLNSLRWNLNTSDSKDVTGDHPGVFGIDPHYMLYKGTQQRDLHINEAKYAYNNGGVVTFDFHQQSRFNSKIYIKDITDNRDKSLMYDIVNDLNGSRQWFYQELDVIIGWINNDLGFPIVFRLFHEMNGNWFWWGTSATNHTQQLYIDFFKLTVDYIRDQSNLVLFSWSPNAPFDANFYPGNDYVDIIGVDIYEPSASGLTSLLRTLSTYAVNNRKVAALTETGYRGGYVTKEPRFWTSTILKAIKDGGGDIKIAWVLAWFNAPWTSSQSDLFIPDNQTTGVAKSDFIDFYNDPYTLFLRDVQKLKMYE